MDIFRYLIPADDDERQIGIDARELPLSSGRIRPPKRGGIPAKMAWDDSILVDEARPGRCTIEWWIPPSSVISKVDWFFLYEIQY